MSRRMLLESELMPVTDGLICWLDGRDGITSTDRMGNIIDINVDKVENGNFIVQQRDGISRYIEIIMNSPFDFNKHSFEIVAKRKDINPHYGRYISYLDNLSYYKIINIGNGMSSVPNRMRFYDFEYNRDMFINSTILNNEDKFIFYYSFDNKNCFLNGRNDSSYHSFPNSKRNNIDKIFLFNDFRKLVTNQVIANISSLKIYNRALTEEEIQQNYLYEQSIERGE